MNSAELVPISYQEWWRGTCSCGEWRSRWRTERKAVELEAQWHDDSPFNDHVVRIRKYAEPAA